MRITDDELSPVLLACNNLSKTFPGGVQALRNINMFVRKHEILGLVGENGAGKSTLLKILAGAYHPTSGRILLNGKVVRPRNPDHAHQLGVFVVYQEGGLVNNISVYENMWLSREIVVGKTAVMKKNEMRKAAKSVLDELGISVDPSKPIASVSADIYKMIEIAKAILIARTQKETGKVEIPLVILDEPTAQLNVEERKRILNDLRKFSQFCSVIFVSHILEEVVCYSDRIIVLRDGVVVGELDSSKADISRVHSMMIGRERASSFYKEDLKNAPGGKVVMTVENLTKKELFEGFSCELHEGEIIGISGLRGGPKEDIGKTLGGLLSPDSGQIQVNNRVIVATHPRDMIQNGVCYIPGDRAASLLMPRSAKENISLPILSYLKNRWQLLNLKKENDVAREYLGALNVIPPDPDAIVEFMSGGNQQKVILAKWLASGPNILVLDNPTRGIDVGTKEEIYKKIREITREGRSIILISDDLAELTGLCHKILVIRERGITHLVHNPASREFEERERELEGFISAKINTERNHDRV